MDCALWLNKHKIYSADEIPRYPDIAALRGYYLGGSLEKWLREHNGEDYADRLSALSCDDGDLNNALAEIFGGKSSISLKEMRGELSEKDFQPLFSEYGSYPRGSYGSYRFGSFPIGSFRFGSFHEWEWEWFFRYGSFGSYRLGSFRFGSFHEWEWEWLLRYGSFGSSRLGSFRFGSFHEWEWEWIFRYGSFGSYRLGSFRFGSFHEWEWEWLFGMGSFGSFRFGSYRFGSFGSYMGFLFGFDPKEHFLDWKSLDEYDRIMLLNLAKCPLNRYGYGIRNI